MADWVCPNKAIFKIWNLIHYHAVFTCPSILSLTTNGLLELPQPISKRKSLKCVVSIEFGFNSAKVDDDLSFVTHTTHNRFPRVFWNSARFLAKPPNRPSRYIAVASCGVKPCFDYWTQSHEIIIYSFSEAIAKQVPKFSEELPCLQDGAAIRSAPSWHYSSITNGKQYAISP